MEPRNWRLDDRYDSWMYLPSRYYPDWRSSPITGKRRAGVTTNKRQGQSKTRRRMAAQSRKINRR